jgi:hypothetical protein
MAETKKAISSARAILDERITVRTGEQVLCHNYTTDFRGFMCVADVHVRLAT